MKLDKSNGFYRFKLKTDYNLISKVEEIITGNLSDWPDRTKKDIVFCIYEAFKNARRYGIKEGEKVGETEIDLLYCIKDNQLTLIIRDYGKGFDSAYYLTREPEEVPLEECKDFGRGIISMRELIKENLGELKYNKKGNLLMMTFNKYKKRKL